MSSEPPDNGDNGSTAVTADLLRDILAALRSGFADVNARLEHLIDLSGEHWRNHEGRIGRLEEQMRALQGSSD